MSLRRAVPGLSAALVLAGAACGDTTTNAPLGAATASSAESSTVTSSGVGGAGGGATTGAGGGGGAASGSGGSGGGGGAGGQAADPCASRVPVCPTDPPLSAGGALVAIDRCAFPLVEGALWGAAGALVDELATKLPAAPLATILDDANRTTIPVLSVPGAPLGYQGGFRWNDEDNDKPWWIPQGITTSADASETGLVAGRSVVAVSSYYDIDQDPGSLAEKGIRVAFVDLSKSPPVYRFALLVEPVAGNPPTFQAVPIHAGGIAWVGDLLYVADTNNGLRVFDTSRALEVATDVDAIGYDAATGAYHAGLYKYVIPQIGNYDHASACGPRFSFVALDRSTDPPSLVSGEYCNGTTACDTALSGRLFRYPLEPATGLLPSPTTYASEAFFAAQSHLQGAASNGGTFYLSSSSPAGSGGALYVKKPGVSASTFPWIDTPEDLSFDVGASRLYGLSEGLSLRYVFWVGSASYP